MAEFPVAALMLACGVFAASAAAKLRSTVTYLSFRAGLGSTGLVPAQLLGRVAAVLCGAEALTAAASLAAVVVSVAGWPDAAVLTEVVLAFAGVLTGVLAGGVAVVTRRGTLARCACFGGGTNRPLGLVHLIRNLCLLAVIGSGLLASPFGARPSVVGTVVAAAAGATVALFFVRWEDLADLFMPWPGAAGAPPRRRPERAER